MVPSLQIQGAKKKIVTQTKLPVSPTSKLASKLINSLKNSNSLEKEEEELLSSFIEEHSDQNDFKHPSYKSIFQLSVERMNNDEFIKKATFLHILRIIQTIRLLSRDSSIFIPLKEKDEIDFTSFISPNLDKFTIIYFQDDNLDFNLQILIELITYTVHCLEKSQKVKQGLSTLQIKDSLIKLLNVQNGQLLESVLDLIEKEIEIENNIVNYINIDLLNHLLQIIEDYSENFKVKALRILSILGLNNHAQNLILKNINGSQIIIKSK